MKTIMALLFAVNTFAATQITGTLVLPANATANGTLRLSVPTGVSLLTSCGGSGGGSYSAGDTVITVTGGVLALSPTIPGNDCFNPPQSRYNITYADSNGNLWSNTWYISGTSFDVGTQVFIQSPRTWTIVSALPTSCAVGDGVFLTTASAGSNWKMCTAPNVWTGQGGGGDGSPCAGGSAGTVQLYGTSMTFACSDLTYVNHLLVYGGVTPPAGAGVDLPSAIAIGLSRIDYGENWAASVSDGFAGAAYNWGFVAASGDVDGGGNPVTPGTLQFLGTIWMQQEDTTKNANYADWGWIVPCGNAGSSPCGHPFIGNGLGDIGIGAVQAVYSSNPTDVSNAAIFYKQSDGSVNIKSLKTTGAATGKKVVCVDTTTGRLYASSTSTDCSN